MLHYDSTNDSYPHRTSSCFLFDSTIPATDINHLAEDINTTSPDFTHTFVISTINCHFCYICYLGFVSFIVFGCHYSYAINLNHLQGRRRTNNFLFLICLMAYQPSWLIECQSHPSKRTAVMLFYPELGG